MNSVNSFRFAVAVLALLLTPMSAEAAGKRRAVGVNPPPLNATISGTVLDNVTGQPVRSAKVTAGEKSDTTDAAGKYLIRNVVADGSGITVKAERSGYASKTATLTAGGAQTVDFRLDPTPTVTVRTTDGVTRQLDFESIRFGYTLPFAGYVDAEHENFCKPDGTAIEVDKSQMKRLIGPATSVQATACCTQTNVLRIRLELKSGEATDVHFVDTCQGYAVDLIGRNHVTGKYEYMRFTDVAEVVFP